MYVLSVWKSRQCIISKPKFPLYTYYTLLLSKIKCGYDIFIYFLCILNAVRHSSIQHCAVRRNEHGIDYHSGHIGVGGYIALYKMLGVPVADAPLPLFAQNVHGAGAVSMGGYVVFYELCLNFLLHGRKARRALAAHVFRNLIGHFLSLRAAADGVRKNVQMGKARFFEKLNALGEVLIRLAGETRYNVGAEGRVRDKAAHDLHIFHNTLRRVLAAHTVERSCAAGLYREMKMRKQRGD